MSVQIFNIKEGNLECCLFDKIQWWGKRNSQWPVACGWTGITEPYKNYTKFPDMSMNMKRWKTSFLADNIQLIEHMEIRIYDRTNKNAPKSNLVFIYI